MTKVILFLVVGLYLSGCGVKGDPVPYISKDIPIDTKDEKKGESR